MEYKNYSEIQVQDFVYNMLMNSIYANLYITDVDTYEVLYMYRIMTVSYTHLPGGSDGSWRVRPSKSALRGCGHRNHSPRYGSAAGRAEFCQSCIYYQ